MIEWRALSFLPLIIGLFVLGVCLIQKDDQQESQKLRNHIFSRLMKLESESKTHNLNDIIPQSTNSKFKIKITNEYIERDGEHSWKYPWLISNENEQILLAEPYKQSQLEIITIDGTLLSTDSTQFKWFVISPDGQSINNFSGQSLAMVFKELGVHAVVVRQYGPGEELQQTVNVKIVVKYVRREIRSLTDEDLEMTLDTMATLWRIPQDLGQELYGKEYLSAAEILKVHLRLAGAKECDHMHDGMGFLPHHSAMTMLFEKSMQAVNPRISLPYWDYAIDFQKIQYRGGRLSDFSDFVNSALFTEKYFGATDTTTHYIKDGRWKGLQVPTTDYLSEKEKETMPHNAFNYMRAPWSSNADPHILRSTSMCGLEIANYFPVPDCSSFDNLYQTTSLVDFGKYVSYDPHGPVHIILGGAVHCEKSYKRLYEVFDDEDEVAYFTAFAFGAHKNLYRWGILECEQGKHYCTCPDLETYMATEKGRVEFFYRMRDTMDISPYTVKQLKMVADVVCNSRLVDGDQLQASSSYAPEFWPIHPTIERLYQWKKLSMPFEDESWLGGTGTWMDEAYNTDICTGHLASDIVMDGLLPFTIGEKEKITNEEYYKMLDPNVDVLPFVYDNFEWPYCDGSDVSL